MRLDRTGDLILDTDLSEIVHKKPLIYQVIGGNTGALPGNVTLSLLNDIVTNINEDFDTGKIDRGFVLP